VDVDGNSMEKWIQKSIIFCVRFKPKMMMALEQQPSKIPERIFIWLRTENPYKPFSSLCVRTIPALSQSIIRYTQLVCPFRV